MHHAAECGDGWKAGPECLGFDANLCIDPGLWPTRQFQCAVKGAGPQWLQVPPGNWIAPPGCNRSGGGANRRAELAGYITIRSTRTDFAERILSLRATRDWPQPEDKQIVGQP